MRLRRVRRLLRHGFQSLIPHSLSSRRLNRRCEGPRLEALEDRTLLSVALVADTNTAPQSSSPSTFVNLNGTMLFSAYDPAHGRELWRTDGTAAGTQLVKDLNPGPEDSFIEGMATLNGAAYVSA